jgi:F-box protein 11
MKGQKPKPAAFMSYDRSDDEYGHVTRFCERLSHEVGTCIGEDFLIFQDRKKIFWGQNWKKRIEESLDEVTFLIPIITPRFFKSRACRDELGRFLKREKKLKRDDLVLPIYYVDYPLLNDEEERAGDELAQAIADHQRADCADWRKLRFKPFDSQEVREALAELGVQIRDALERVQTSEKKVALEQDADATRRPAAKTPTRIVDQMHRGDHLTITESIEPEKVENILNILKGNEQRVIKELNDSGEMKQAELSTRIGLSRSALSRMLQDLEGRGLILRYGNGVRKMVKLSDSFKR